jgi:type II secretory pathway pseudopilin PulG
MGLAVFEGLLFPLLALDTVLIGLSIFIALQIKFVGMAGVHSSENVSMLFKFAFLLMVIAGPASAVLVDVLILKRIWHSVNQPIGITPSRQKPDRFWRRFAIGAACVVCIPLVIAVFGMLAAILIPNFVRHRAQVQVAAEQQRKQAVMHRLQNTAQQLETNAIAAFIETPESDRDEEDGPVTQPVLLSSGGVTFEFVGVGSLSGSNQLWWLPDGHPTTNDFSSQTGFFKSQSRTLPTRTLRFPGAPLQDSTPMHSYTFVLRSGGAATGLPHLEIGSQSVSLMLRPIFHPLNAGTPTRRSTEYLYVGNVELPEDQSTVDCTLSFPAGPWMVDEAIPNFRSGNVSGIKIICGGLNWTVTTRLEETNDAVRLTGSHPLFWSAGWDQQLVLLAGDGSAYNYSTNESVLNNGSITRMEVDQTYKNLSLDDVRDVRFRIRPYQRFSIRNVSLESGRLTTVEVTNTTHWKTVPPDFKVESLKIVGAETNKAETAFDIEGIER